jgi:hypothetical protein
MAEVKRCGAPKFGIVCDAILAEKNNSGFCAKHFYYSKKDPKDYQPLRKAGDHNGDGRRDVARHVSPLKSPALPAVAITTNGNVHAATEPPFIDRSPTRGANPVPLIAMANGNGNGTIASDGAYLVPCQVSEWTMDRIWLRLTPEEKAELLFRPPEAAPQQQEPAHHA